jgi:hypothetical protein
MHLVLIQDKNSKYYNKLGCLKYIGLVYFGVKFPEDNKFYRFKRERVIVCDTILASQIFSY